MGLIPKVGCVTDSLGGWGGGQHLWHYLSPPYCHPPHPFRQQEAPDLFQWLCSDSLKLCCPAGTFGPSCLREFLSSSQGMRGDWQGQRSSPGSVL